MRIYLIIYLLISFLTTSAAHAQASHPAATSQVTDAPSQAYLLLATDCCKLLRRAAALPDAQGVSLLRRQAPPLQARAKPVTQAYARWLKTQSPAQLKVEENRIMHSGFAQELETIVASLGPKAKHSPAFIQQVSNLMEAMAEGL